MYEIYRDNDRSTWKWNYTTGSTTTSNSRVGVRPPDSSFIRFRFCHSRLGEGITIMTTEESVIEETRINPGEEWKEGGTYDLSIILGWARLKDEETRRVDNAFCLETNRNYRSSLY